MAKLYYGKEFLGREILIEQLNNIQVIKESGFDFYQLRCLLHKLISYFRLI